MTLTFALGLVAAGFIYIITPGPVFLAIIALVSQSGRKAGFTFISGAVLGCMVWLGLTCAALIEAERLHPLLFKILSMLCGFYLLYLGVRMIIHNKSSKEEKKLIFKSPFRDGLTLALLNPKSYPVMLSVIGSVLSAHNIVLEWSYFSFIFAYAVTGFILGYMTMVMVSGTKFVTVITQRYFHWMMVSFGFIFIGFGFHLLLASITNSVS